MRFAQVRPVRRVCDALAWRLRRVLGDQRVDRAIERMAECWRSVLHGPVYVGVTGSAGKTTTKELLLGVLAHRGRGIGSPATFNRPTDIAKTILRVRPTHAFCVVELSEARPGEMDEELAILRPSVGIVTVVGTDHSSTYGGSRQAIAAEVRKLVACLPRTGAAVLNADDALVLAMAEHFTGEVITYGLASDAAIRAEDVSAAWPDRLALTVVRGSERVAVRTQLCGAHWIPSVLAAIGGGIAAGASLRECADGVASVPPFEGRMQPVSTRDGVTFIRDDYKAPVWAVDLCFQFLSAAHARRKIVVIGTLTDFEASIELTYRRLAKRALEIADVTIFAGPWASSILKIRKPGDADRLLAFSHVRDAALFVNSIAADGDLVLLKGNNIQDHLFRIALSHSGDIACWRDDCNRQIFCDACPERTKPSGAPVPQRAEALADATAEAPLARSAVAADEQVIIGLGNPDPKYAGTPHNLGYEVVDGIASSLGLTWDAYPDAWMAQGEAHGRGVRLIKLPVAMNLTGAALKQLAQRISFGPQQCVLVHDDLDVALGSVRVRASGSAGGHRGVASILEAFQTDAFRRVKVGVGTPEARLNRNEYVITAFAAASRAIVDQAIVAAEARAIELAIGRRTAPV